MTQDFSPRMTPPFSDGVLLAINSIPDSALAVEGPACVRTKLERICRIHDLHSTLHDAAGGHRVCTTDRGPASVLGSMDPLRSSAQAMLDELHPAALFLLPFAVQQAMGMDLEGVAAELARSSNTHILTLQSLALDGDWLDGWATVFSALAERVPSVPERHPDSVCLAGLMHTRDEADDVANVQGVTGLLDALGLTVESVWSGGGTVEQLMRAAGCRHLVGLPHAAPFASGLATAVGARFCDATLPVGLSGTTEFLRAVGGATGRAREAEQLARAETRRCAALLNNFVSTMADDISVALLADRDMAPALHGALTEIGIDVPLTGILSARSLPESISTLSGRVAVDPSFPAWEELLFEAAQGGVQMVVGSGLSEVAAHKAGVDLVELGFPSANTHFLTPAPYLGYQGFLRIVERIANTYSQGDARQRLDAAARTGRN